MIEKKEDVCFDRSRKACGRPAFELARREMKSLTVLVRAVHILPAGPRTRRSQAGKHGASGVEKPQETRSREVAPRRKVGSLDRQVPGGHTSKVRRRSRCVASYPILEIERQAQDKAQAQAKAQCQAKAKCQAKAEDSLGPLCQTGPYLSSLASRSLVSLRRFARKKLLARKLPGPKRQARTQVARFPASSICPAATNRQARWPSA